MDTFYRSCYTAVIVRMVYSRKSENTISQKGGEEWRATRVFVFLWISNVLSPRISIKTLIVQLLCFLFVQSSWHIPFWSIESLSHESHRMCEESKDRWSDKWCSERCKYNFTDKLWCTWKCLLSFVKDKTLRVLWSKREFLFRRRWSTTSYFKLNVNQWFIVEKESTYSFCLVKSVYFC
jgi:hypothetical protein